MCDLVHNACISTEHMFVRSTRVHGISQTTALRCAPSRVRATVPPVFESHVAIQAVSYPSRPNCFVIRPKSFNKRIVRRGTVSYHYARAKTTAGAEVAFDSGGGDGGSNDDNNNNNNGGNNNNNNGGGGGDDQFERFGKGWRNLCAALVATLALTVGLTPQAAIAGSTSALDAIKERIGRYLTFERDSIYLHLAS